MCKQLCMVREGTGDRECLIYSLIYQNKLTYFQLLTVLAYGNSLPKLLAKALKNTCG